MTHVVAGDARPDPAVFTLQVVVGCTRACGVVILRAAVRRAVQARAVRAPPLDVHLLTCATTTPMEGCEGGGCSPPASAWHV
eukprot:363618-Chlamydomonas_euryale.AAC.5